MKLILSIAAAFLFSSPIFAQTNNAWKKTVYRTIDVTQKEDTVKHHLTDVTSDTTLIEIIVSAVKAGKLVAYNSFDHNYTTKLTKADLLEMTGGRTDTQIVVDPVTNEERRMIIRHDFDPAFIRKYRLLEEWTFDPHTGKTGIQITGIAPVIDVYGDDGAFRGSKSMFWLRYADASSALARYDRLHPTQTFASLIWEDYFLSDAKPRG